MSSIAGVRGIWRYSGGLTLLVIGLLLLGGCSLFQSVPSGPKSYTTQNDLIEYTRVVPQQVRVGSVFTVEVTVKAKVELALLAIAEQLPTGFLPAVANEPLTALGNSLKPGDEIRLSYQVQASSETGTFQLVGRARALPPGKDSVMLPLGTPVKVTR